MTLDQTPRPHFMIFDWDNTLVDSWACLEVSLNMTFDKMGLPPWSKDEVKARLALSLRDHFPKLFGERWEEARDVFYAAFKSVHLDYLKPLDGVEAMLDRLKDMGVPMGVVSNKTGIYLREEAQHLGWTGYFHRLIGATDAERDKPAPEPISLVLQGSGVAPCEHVWFLGDAPVDMQCALASGCKPVLLRQAPPGEDEFKAHPPSMSFESPRELLLTLGFA